jgi:hypothetical protein
MRKLQNPKENKAGNMNTPEALPPLQGSNQCGAVS